MMCSLKLYIKRICTVAYNGTRLHINTVRTTQGICTYISIDRSNMWLHKEHVYMVTDYARVKYKSSVF